MTGDRTLASLQGQIAWMPQKGVGTFITMEFGAPHLVIREPIPHAPPMSRLRRRNATVVGEQHLWLQADDWIMHSAAGPRSSSDEPIEIERSLKLLNGQTLLRIGRDSTAVQFEFEYGERLVLDFGPDPEQVLLGLYWFRGGNLFLLNSGKLVHEAPDDGSPQTLTAG